MTRADMAGWPFLERMRRDLKESIQIGAALAGVVAFAGCGGQSEGAPLEGAPLEGAPLEGAGGALGSSGTSQDAEPPAPPEVAPAPGLDPVPAELLGCVGPTYDDGFHGQCCFTQRCYVPAPGADCSEDFRALEVSRILPPGSGECSCRGEGRAYVSGPFAPNHSVMASSSQASAEPAPEGSCCYVVGGIGCTGRPFVVSESQRVAGRAWRDDWGLFV